MNRGPNSLYLSHKMFPQINSDVYRVPSSYKPPADKDLVDNLEYPNLNVRDMNAHPENLSPRLHDCWDSITMNEEKHFALATNRRDGVNWWGLLFGYSQIDHINVDNADFKKSCEYVINIVCYSSNNVLLAALGDTRLQAWSTYSPVRDSNSPYCLYLVGEAAAHRLPINQLSVFETRKQQAVTSSWDNAINVWDLSSADLCNSYRARVAHKGKITGLATSSRSDAQFISCDRNGCSLLWDLRAGPQWSTWLVKETNMLSFTCAEWASHSGSQDDSIVYLGDYDGKVHAFDIRVPDKKLETFDFFEESEVSKLLTNGTHLAAMGNFPSCVKIQSLTGEREVVYEKENPHIRLTDAVWRDEHTLLTTGHGHKLQKHKIK